MEEEAQLITGMVREFGDKFNRVIKEDIESLPPAGRLYPKFYIKVCLLKL